MIERLGKGRKSRLVAVFFDRFSARCCHVSHFHQAACLLILKEHLSPFAGAKCLFSRRFVVDNDVRVEDDLRWWIGPVLPGLFMQEEDLRKRERSTFVLHMPCGAPQCQISLPSPSLCDEAKTVYRAKLAGARVQPGEGETWWCARGAPLFGLCLRRDER